ncbi:hypothetical protein A4X20_12395 [Mycolicibacterium iranicum]|uniref:Uncharacterized protein n=1 Tax=Mycolicibacterium iranicum TaxID=912594 RepID=A0A178LB94_MYCIR|nr:hypothetical protein A4X20_12395 [Mycolicibacterium iranicum]
MRPVSGSPVRRTGCTATPHPDDFVVTSRVTSFSTGDDKTVLFTGGSAVFAFRIDSPIANEMRVSSVGLD